MATNIIEVEYNQTGQSTSIDSMGMREMQQKAFEKRNSQYLILKAPPASGKSRALMYIALDKLINQGLQKVIVCVPERSIGGSFSQTKLTETGFFADWNPSDKYNLCTSGGEKSKVQAFTNFLDSEEKILICTHHTLRYAFENIENSKFDNCLLAIDEFHHVSADDNNKLGSVIKQLVNDGKSHILAMTGSYFRGDSVPVLLPEDEVKFDKVTYNYYDQLNGYEYLKSLGIGYHFYTGKYTSAINDVLDTDKKTILHIPNVNSGESTKQKKDEVDFILDSIGQLVGIDPETEVHFIKRHKDGKIIKIANLVEDDTKKRDKIVNYLRIIKSPEDMDLIIALGMAKEGFDWPFCEHALTVGYRSSMTEIIQIIGRATRDSKNKIHTQFTNLIASPDAENMEVKLSVNNMLKAITASLLMEQVLAPNFKFKQKIDDSDKSEKGVIKIKGFKEPKSLRVKTIIESDLNDLKAGIMQDQTMLKAMPGGADPEVINKVYIPRVIMEKYPDLGTEEVEELRQYVVADSVIKNAQITNEGNKQFITMANRFVNIDDISIDLIDQINPFQKAFEILSKSVTANVLRLIRDTIEATKIQITEAEAVILAPKLLEFVKRYGKNPDLNSIDPQEKRLAEVKIFLTDLKRKKQANDSN
jgi:superfamily II DNA or RNA helicase